MLLKPPFSLRRYPSLVSVLNGTIGAECSLVDAVYDAILLRIINREIEAGEELKSTQLAGELDVSRTPVIQALARLSADGIVLQQINRRAIVRAGAENWLLDIHQLREQIEPRAAAGAAGRIPRDVQSDLAMLARDARPTSEEDCTEEARMFDYALHLVVAEHCGNLPMRETIRRCWRYKRIAYQANQDSHRDLGREYEEHCDIMEHLISGNAAAASRVMRDHLKAATRRWSVLHPKVSADR